MVAPFRGAAGRLTQRERTRTARLLPLLGHLRLALLCAYPTPKEGCDARYVENWGTSAGQSPRISPYSGVVTGVWVRGRPHGWATAREEDAVTDTPA